MRLSICTVGLVLFALAGCGSNDGSQGKEFSQDFQKPANATANASKSDPDANLSTMERRRRDKEDSIVKVSKNRKNRN